MPKDVETQVIETTSADIQKFFDLTAGRSRLTNQNFDATIHHLAAMSEEDLRLLARADWTPAKRPNSENEIFRALIHDRLLKTGVDSFHLEPLNLITSSAELRMSSNSEDSVSALVVEADTTIRAREDFKLSAEVAGFYRSKSSKRGASKEMYVPCRVTDVHFTDRVGLLPIISSVRIHIDVDTDPMQKTSTRANLTPVISERSFQTTVRGWAEFLRLAQQVSKKHYKTNNVCFRQHFVADFNQLNIVTNRRRQLQVIAHQMHYDFEAESGFRRLAAEYNVEQCRQKTTDYAKQNAIRVSSRSRHARSR